MSDSEASLVCICLVPTTSRSGIDGDIVVLDHLGQTINVAS